ncbi:MAG TPA: hypothetical protein VIY90_06260 [Steroidobacteraceae bacterium]
MRALHVVLSAAALAIVSLNTSAAVPDLSGVWFIDHHVGALKTVDGKAPPLTPAAQAVYEAHQAAIAKGDFSFDGATHCLPPGLPRLMLMHEPFEILQRPKTLYFVHQINRLPRRVYLDEPLPTDVDPHYLGYSVGKWDGDALVVDSNGFEDGTMLDNAGLPHSDALHLTERYQLSKDGMHLHLLMTIDDPKTFTQDWSAKADYTKRPGFEIPEEVCADTPAAKRPRN